MGMSIRFSLGAVAIPAAREPWGGLLSPPSLTIADAASASDLALRYAPRRVEERHAAALPAVLRGPHWLEVFTGQAEFPAGSLRHLTHDRVLALRESAFVADLFRTDRFARRWLRHRGMMELLGLILLHCRPDDAGRTARLREELLIRVFAERWQSLRTRLHYAEQEGYVTVERFGGEGGVWLRIGALPPLIEEAQRLARHAMAYCSLLGAASMRLEDFSGEARWSAILVGTLMLCRLGVRLQTRGLRHDCINFFFTIFDLHVYGPMERNRFVRREAKSLGLSRGTMGAVVAYAKAEGWIEEAECLHLTALGRARIAVALAVVGERARAIGQVLDACRRTGVLPVAPDRLFPDPA